MRSLGFKSIAAAVILAGSAALSAAQGQGPPRPNEANRPLPKGQQQQRVNEQKQRDATVSRTLATHARAAQAQVPQLQQQKRNAQVAVHQQYIANLQQQQQRIRTHNYTTDPYYATPSNFRYRLNGVYRETNQYGADELRAAVNNGYQQGYRAGAADRQDGWKSNYQQAYGYQDANFGYDGSYIPQPDYNYYFRQGFQRGYEDGYASQYRYGSLVNGSPSILGNILSGILGLTTLH